MKSLCLPTEPLVDHLQHGRPFFRIHGFTPACRACLAIFRRSRGCPAKSIFLSPGSFWSTVNAFTFRVKRSAGATSPSDRTMRSIPPLRHESSVREPNTGTDDPLPKKRIATPLVMACCACVRRMNLVVMIDSCAD